MGILIFKYFVAPLVTGGILLVFANLIFAKKLEDYRTKENLRQKAILIANLLSEWCSDPEDNKILNQLTWEATIWLPKDIAAKLNQCLSYSKDAPNIKEIIADVRKLILGKKQEIDANTIIHFPFKKKDKAVPTVTDTKIL